MTDYPPLQRPEPTESPYNEPVLAEDFSEEIEPDMEAAPAPVEPLEFPEENSRIRDLLWQRKLGPAFWTITGSISLTVNIILIVVLVFLAIELFSLKALVGDQLLGGLYTNFVKMDAATITTTVNVNDTIQVDDTIPVVFTLPLEQETVVILTEDTFIEGAIVSIDTPSLKVLNATTNILLPAGSELPVALSLLVPVSTTIPVRLTVPVVLEVPVEIPLDGTELHEPFVGLQDVVAPYNDLLMAAPNSWPEAICSVAPDSLCTIEEQQ